MKLNEHGIWTVPTPLRFRSLEEANAWMDGKLKASDLLKPYIKNNGVIENNKDYQNAPYEQVFIASPEGVP